MKTCQGVRRLKEDCVNDAEYEVVGLVASYGGPSTQNLCEMCLEQAKVVWPNGYPMILSYNQFKLAWRKIDSNTSFENVKGKKVVLDGSLWVA